MLSPRPSSSTDYFHLSLIISNFAGKLKLTSGSGSIAVTISISIVMRRIVFLVIIAFLSAALFVSCSKSPEKKLAGTWKVEDVKFDSSRKLDPAQLENSKQMAKSVSYELMEDKSAKIHVGSTVLEGSWSYKEAENNVFMSFTGSMDTVLLGSLEEDKLINIATKSDIKITTIFVKESN